MSTPSRMTIAWDRLDQMALLPQDSSVVIPPPITTIAWTPLLGPTIFDYDPSDFVITPGAGEEVVTTPQPTGGGGGGTAPGTGESPPPPHYGHPRLTVAHRRSLKLFLKDGLFVDVHTTAPAHVRAVLETKVAGLKGKAHTVNLTKVLTAEVGTEERKLTLHPSRAGRMALKKLQGSTSATLVVVVNYGNGRKPIRMNHHLRIVGG
jgi:hypothetical protein